MERKEDDAGDASCSGDVFPDVEGIRRELAR